MSAPSSKHQTPRLMLTADRVRALLDAGGYESAIIVAHQQQELPAGCSVALEFGDRIARNVDGTTQMSITCSVVLNGSEGRVAGVTRWQIGKVVPMAVDQDRLLLALDVELLLGSTVRLDDVLLSGGEVLRHLRVLLADARTTLGGVPVDDRRGQESPSGSPPGSPARLRIEARFAADLAVGRSGMVRQGSTAARSTAAPVRTTTHQAKMSMAACDGLADHVLPDLARALRTSIGPEVYRAAAFRLPALQGWLRTSSREDDHMLATSRTLQ